MMQYKGYIGRVEYEEESGVFFGEVTNIRDVITFEGTSVEELRRAFHDSVDDYLEFCAERGYSNSCSDDELRGPEKPFSGYVTVHLSPELHRRAYVQAERTNKSLEGWISEIIETSLSS